MILMEINKLPGLSLIMERVFEIISIIIIENNLAMVVRKTYQGKPVNNANFYPIHGFVIANTKYYTKSRLSDFKRSLPKSVHMDVTESSITFCEIDKATREAKKTS